jgi:hypothetical protein
MGFEGLLLMFAITVTAEGSVPSACSVTASELRKSSWDSPVI